MPSVTLLALVHCVQHIRADHYRSKQKHPNRSSATICIVQPNARAAHWSNCLGISRPGHAGEHKRNRPWCDEGKYDRPVHTCKKHSYIFQEVRRFPPCTRWDSGIQMRTGAYVVKPWEMLQNAPRLPSTWVEAEKVSHQVSLSGVLHDRKTAGMTPLDLSIFFWCVV